MARRPSKGQEPGDLVLGCAVCVTISFVGSAVTDYFVEGPERFTADYLTARGLVLGVTWLAAAAIAAYLHRRGR
jgi:hypothetical protein